MGSNSVIPEGFQLESDSNIPEGFVLEGTLGAPVDKPENFLKRAIEYAGALVPQSGAELGDVGKMAFRQLPMGRGGQVGPMTMGPFGAGANIGGIKEIGGMPLNTEWGKVMESQVVDPSLIASGGILGMKRLGQGIGNLFNVSKARQNLSGVVRKGAESAEGSISRMSQEANKAMTPSLGKIERTGIGKQQIDDILSKTALEIDPTGTTHGMEGSLANNVLKLKGQIPYSEMNGPQLQSAIVELKNQLGRLGSKAQGTFNTLLKEVLPKDFRSIQETRGVTYAVEEAARPLTKQGTLNKIARGTADKELLKTLKEAEKNVPGLNIIENLIKSGKSVKRTSVLQGVASGALKASPYLVGLGWLLNKMGGK